MFCPSLDRFMTSHYKDPKSQRLGQHFVNNYIKGQWPELFYCSDDHTAANLIGQWLVDHQYTDTLPQVIRPDTDPIKGTMTFQELMNSR